MFKKTPTPENKAAKISAVISIAGGVLVFILTTAIKDIPFPGVAQFIGLLLVAYAIYIAGAYLLRRYTFIIEPSEDEDTEPDHDLIINEQKGSRKIKVCHVSVKKIEFIRIVDSQNKKQVSEDRKAKDKYTYDTQFAATKRLEIAIKSGSEEASMLVTYDEELVKALLTVGVRKI